MKLVHNWKRGWRWFSIQADMIPLAITGSWMVLPYEWKHAVPERWMLYMAMCSFILGTVGRLIKQEPDNETTQTYSGDTSGIVLSEDWRKYPYPRTGAGDSIYKNDK